MNHDYEDITSRIVEPPRWFDERAVPRYCEFGPSHSANIYADEAVLFVIECQACRTPFRVCLTSDSSMRAVRGHIEKRAPDPSLAEQVRSHTLEYGDPPNMGCCPSGPTMNSVPRRVLEYWYRRSGHGDWERDEKLEADLHCDWDEP